MKVKATRQKELVTDIDGQAECTGKPKQRSRGRPKQDRKIKTDTDGTIIHDDHVEGSSATTHIHQETDDPNPEETKADQPRPEKPNPEEPKPKEPKPEQPKPEQ